MTDKTVGMEHEGAQHIADSVHIPKGLASLRQGLTVRLASHRFEEWRFH